jgi:hypothetical protein
MVVNRPLSGYLWALYGSTGQPKAMNAAIDAGLLRLSSRQPGNLTV